MTGPVVIVSGHHGTGKSTYARALAEALNLRYISAGELFRELAKEKGMTLEGFSKVAAENPEIDKIIDERTKAEAKKGGLVIDAQLGAWMAKELADVKVLMVAPDEVRLKRIADREKITIADARKETLTREMIQKRRYKQYYGIDVDDLRIYDLKIDTSLHSVEKTKAIVIEAVQKFLARNAIGTS